MNRALTSWSCWRFVVRLRDQQQSPWTGSIIGPHHVLTAAHCVVDCRRRVAHQKDTFLQAYGESKERTGYDIDWIAAHPDYRFSKEDGMRYGFRNDVALIRVREQLPDFGIRCLSRAEEMRLADGTTAIQLGFGKNASEHGAQLWRCEGDFLRYKTPSPDFYHEGTLATRTDTRDGDSGGPLVVDGRTAGLSVAWAQIGVHSLGGTQGGAVCDMGACARTAHDEVFEWIDHLVPQTVKSLRSDSPRSECNGHAEKAAREPAVLETDTPSEPA